MSGGRPSEASIGRGLIARIGQAGVESEELAKETPMARVGGAKIPYRPQDLAAIISILGQRNPETYLALEARARGGLEFIGSVIGGLVLQPITEHNGSERELRTFLRRLPDAFDVITIDGRDLKLDPHTLWRYVEGGKEPRANEFGKGATVNYGTRKIKQGSLVVLNLVDPATKALWHKLRMRYTPVFSSPYAGMVRI